MPNTKSSKKALIILFILITVGVSTTYFTYDYFGESPKEDNIVKNQQVIPIASSNTEDNNSTQKEEEVILNKPNSNTLLVSAEVKESTITEITRPVNIQDIEKQLSDNKVVDEEFITETVNTEIDEIIEIKPSIQVTKIDESHITAKWEIEKVNIDKSSLDPFNLFISSELKGSDIFEKYDYGLYVNSLNKSNGKIIDGDVQVYDNIRSKRISTVSTHTLAGINDPKNQSQSVRIISSVFGYKPQEISFSLNDASNYVPKTQSSVNSLSDSVIRVDLNLERLQAGDIAVMWKVFFFKDAAIMQARSKPELQDLFTMMNENSKMKIKLHGHTNGNSHGKVIHLGEGDNDDLFNIKSPKHVETVGSAQKLSLYRAETIQHYLLSRGIDQSRIEIKGWGGKKMLHDKHDGKANLNVRVEVEILEN